MKYVLAALLTLFAAIVQVTVVPLFPLRGAVADLGLVTILAMGVAMGPRVAMWVVPLFAVLLSFSTDRQPGLLLLAYLPVLPFAYVVEQLDLPANRLVRGVGTGIAAGVWIRTVLAAGAMVSGAGFALQPLIASVLIPGLAFDAALVALVFLAIRLTGREPRSLTLARTGWW